jgi:hypothetical protein
MTRTSWVIGLDCFTPWLEEFRPRALSFVCVHRVCKGDHGEYVLNDGKTGPRIVARRDLNILVAARGRAWTAAEYGAWVHTCGVTLQRIYQTSTGKHFLIARRA